MKAYLVSPAGVTEIEISPHGQSVISVDLESAQPLAGTAWGDRFVWVTHKGVPYFVEQMATPHLFYAFRMVYNHSVPPVFRVGEFRRWPDVDDWSVARRRKSIDALYAELKKRDDLELEFRQQLSDIEQNCRVIVALGL